MERGRPLLTLVSLVLAAALSGPAQSVSGQARPGEPTAPQAPSRDTSSAKEGTGVLRGRVLAMDTGAPLRRARLSLSAPGAGQPRSTIADLEGRYEFKHLPAGRYMLTASKAPYLSLQVGQRSPFERGRPIELGEGQTIERVDIALARGSVIAGSVVDDLGEPAASIRVVAMRLQYFEGRRQLVPVGRSARTNDIGHFRLYGLAPGTYFVRTQPTTWNSMSAQNEGISFAATYYPGSVLVDEAQPVTLRVGQERMNIDVSLVVARMARLSGIAVDPRGRLLAGRSVMLVELLRGPSSTSGVSTGGTAVQSDGRFTIPNVAAGEYVLSAFSTDPQTGERETARLPVTVTGDDLDGLMVMTSAGVSISGQIEFEGDLKPTFSPQTVRILAAELGPRRLTGTGSTAVSEDWSFAVRGVAAGPHALRVSGLPTGWALKAVYAGADDVTDTPLQVTDRRNVTDVRVFITNRGTELTGAVSDERGAAVGEYSVVVFAEDAARWSEQSRFLATVRPDQHGRFVVRGLPPGEYLAAALEYLEEGQGNDPEFLEGLRSNATALVLGEGEHKALDLKLVKIEARD
jgi:hypothetical protein